MQDIAYCSMPAVTGQEEDYTTRASLADQMSTSKSLPMLNGLAFKKMAAAMFKQCKQPPSCRQHSTHGQGPAGQPQRFPPLRGSAPEHW